MKRFLTIFISLFMLLVLSSCSQANADALHSDNTYPGCCHNASPVSSNTITAAPAPLTVPQELIFFSLEEFLYAHGAAMEGRPLGEMSQMAELLDFSSMDRVHLLSNIAEEYKIGFIRVQRYHVSIYYFPEDFIDCTEARRNAMLDSNYLQLRFERFSRGDALQMLMSMFELTEEDLIEGKYFFRELVWSRLHWVQYNKDFSLMLPRPPLELRATAPLGYGIIGFTGDTVYDLLPLTETITIDILDEELVAELIGELYQLSFDLGFSADGHTALTAIEPIYLPANVGIRNFITTHHQQIPLNRFSMPGDNTFLGWYLDPQFTIPLSLSVPLMPNHNTTLYANWELVPGNYAKAIFLGMFPCGSSEIIIEVAPGTLVTPPELWFCPDDDGFVTFMGWRNEATGFIAPPGEQILITENVVFTPKLYIGIPPDPYTP